MTRHTRAAVDPRPGVVGGVILDDADHPAVENGRYCIGYIDLVDGYRHAFYDERTRKVRYSRTPAHPADPRCPECNPAREASDG